MTDRRTLPLIYIVDGSVAVTGAFVCARNIARALKGVARVVLVLPSNAEIPPTELVDFVGVRYLPIRPLRRNLMAALLYIPALLYASAKLRRLLDRDRAVALILNDFYLVQGVLCRPLGFRGPIVTWVRMVPSAFGKVMPGIWLRLATYASDQIVAVSIHIKNLLPSWASSEVLYDALGTDAWAAGSEERSDGSRFVFVGNYMPGKGQHHAVEAFARIARGHWDLRLEFYGGDMGLAKNRYYRDQLRTRISELGLTDRIVLGDFAPDPRQVLSGALAAVNLSDSEAFSMVVLEALATGVPVIATRSGGPSEIVQDGVTGILVPVGDVEAVAKAMQLLARDPALAVRMGAAGKEDVAMRFSMDQFRDSLVSLLAGIPRGPSVLHPGERAIKRRKTERS